MALFVKLGTLLAVLSIVLSFLEIQAGGTKCYKCDSHRHQCSSVHMLTPTIECKFGCSKLRRKSFLADAHYVRGCSTAKFYKGCAKLSWFGTSQEECDCKEDLCNVGTSLTAKPPILVVLITLYRLFAF